MACQGYCNQSSLVLVDPETFVKAIFWNTSWISSNSLVSCALLCDDPRRGVYRLTLEISAPVRVILATTTSPPPEEGFPPAPPEDGGPAREGVYRLKLEMAALVR